MQEMSQAVHNVLYWSRCRKMVFDVTDIDIMRSSIKNNAANNLTGFLHREAGFYIQHFEGPEPAVSQLHKALFSDKRHFNFQVVRRGQTNERLFSDWSMGYSNETESRIGLSEGKVEPSEVDPDRLLSFLRDVAKANDF